MSIPHYANGQGLVTGLRNGGMPLASIKSLDIVRSILFHVGPIVPLQMSMMC